jgi:hypothetical protein
MLNLTPGGISSAAHGRRRESLDHLTILSAAALIFVIG